MAAKVLANRASGAAMDSAKNAWLIAMFKRQAFQVFKT